MLKVYGSKMCSDCRECRANFDDNGIEYEFIDINERLHNLSEFLKLRDKYSVFDQCREAGDIGLPALVKEDGEVFLDWEDYMRKAGLEPAKHEPLLKACSLKRKGC